MHTYTHTHTDLYLLQMHTCPFINICTQIQTLTQAPSHIHAYIHTHKQTNKQTHRFILVAYAHMPIHLYMNTNTTLTQAPSHIHAYIYALTHLHTRARENLLRSQSPNIPIGNSSARHCSSKGTKLEALRRQTRGGRGS